MSFTPPPHPNTRPRQAAAAGPRGAGDREFVAEWLAHVEAGRLGNTPDTPEEIRAIVLANERLICGRRRSPPE